MSRRLPYVRMWLMLRWPALQVGFLVAGLLMRGEVRWFCLGATMMVGAFGLGVVVSVRVFRRMISDVIGYARQMEEINRKICERARERL